MNEMVNDMKSNNDQHREETLQLFHEQRLIAEKAKSEVNEFNEEFGMEKLDKRFSEINGRVDDLLNPEKME